MEVQPRPTSSRRLRALIVSTAVGALVVMSTGIGLAAGGFSDVPTNHPFADEIEWLADTEISTGFPDGTFRPDAAVTRQAMAAFMQRLAGQDDDVDPMVDAATLRGRGPSAFVQRSGFNHTAIPGHAFISSQADVKHYQGRSVFSQATGVMNMYGSPHVDTGRWGIPMYLHGAEVCLGHQTTRTIDGIEVRVYRQTATAEHTEIFSQTRSFPGASEGGASGCYHVAIDLDEDDIPASLEGFELAATDRIEVRVWSNPASGPGNVAINGATIVTSPLAVRYQFIIPPIIINPPIIIDSDGTRADISSADIGDLDSDERE